jgi:benzoate-CoA ligase family protein
VATLLSASRGRNYTYDELLGRVGGAATGLAGLGVRPEERVFMVLLDGIDYAVTFLGALRLGAIPVPVNPGLPPPDIAAIAADARARVAVVSPEREASAPPVDEVVVGTDAWGSAAGPQCFDSVADSPAFWLCTSGTTGQPKLAMHRQGDIRFVAETYGREVLGIGPDDRFFSVAPMFHAYGLGNSLLFPFSVGATVVIDPVRPPTPAGMAEVLGNERPTLFFGIPTLYAALAASDIASDTFASVRYAVSAAEVLPAEISRRFTDRFGIDILDGIGSTEALHIFLSNTPGRIRPGTTGTVVPGWEAEVRDDDGRPAPDGQPGHLWVKGESLASGYWCRTALSRWTFVGEWARTGDTYVRDADGFFTYLGRSDDMIKVWGEWVSPAEVEAALVEHPGVLEAAVVGADDENGLTAGVAYVIARDGAELDPDELIRFCAKRLGGFKRPRRITVVDELPKTVTGKIQRFKLR